MTIVITKQSNGKFVARVHDCAITFISGANEADFTPFRDGIVADGNTWGEALENIIKQINKYLSVYMEATRDVPEFVKNEVVNIINENINVDDLMK